VLFATKSGASTRVGLAATAGGFGLMTSLGGLLVGVGVGFADGVDTVPSEGDETTGPGARDDVVGEPRHCSNSATKPATTATAKSERTSKRKGDGGAACVPRPRPGCRGDESSGSSGSVTADSQTARCAIAVITRPCRGAVPRGRAAVPPAFVGVA
jgi:hypothetical protein